VNVPVGPSAPIIASLTIGGCPSAILIARAEEDPPPLVPEPAGCLEAKSLVASGDQHRGVFRVRHAL
jgi:hypothetical protein